MKIIYSPHYDGEIFLGDQPGYFDTLYAGNLSLLQQLGLRAGICVSPAPDMEREVAYQTAMRQPLVSTRFESSAQTDPIGVAAKLLLWRDNLIMAGWDGTCDDASLTKLHTLAEIEKIFHQTGSCMGTADYWSVICQQYESTTDFPNPITEIQIDCPWSEIPYLIQRTLNALENRGARLIMTVDESKQVELQPRKIKVVQFTDLLDAYEWMARVKETEDCAIINRDNVRLNHTLYTWNKPAVYASLTQSNPQLLQLFKLSLSVFSRPLNLNNLVSYLQLPSGPIPKSLRFKLLRLLLKDGGFGEVKMREDGNPHDDWDEVIRTYEFKEYDKDGKPKTGDSPDIRKAKMNFLDPIRQDFSKGLSKTDLNTYVDHMQNWVNGILLFDKKRKEAAAKLPATTDESAIMELLNEERTQQLHELSAMFSAFRQSLAAMPDTVTYGDIEKMVLRIYRPMSYTLQQAEQQSLNVINDIRSMAVPADTLIWLDCQAEDIERDPYDFLSTPERQYLAKRSVQIPDFAHHLKICRQERNRLLNSVTGKVILVQSLYDGVQRLGEHSLVAEVKHLCGETFQYADAKTILSIKSPTPEEKEIDTFEPQMYYNIQIPAFNGRQESNSSIEKLIQRPFNYVMDYVANLPAPDDEQLKSPYITTGLVAHHFFQHIIEAGNNYTAMRNLTDSSFDQYLDAAIQATGLIMLLEENATQLHNFRWQLKQSMLTLIDIMEHLNLTPVGCEIKFPETGKTLSLPTIGDFGARIDFLLTNSNGDYVIFDFKWSYSKMYPEKLEEDASIQLELYRQAVLATYPGKNVVGIGYYMMPKQQLFTPDFNDWDNKICKVVPANPQQVFQQIQNSYNFRKEELMNGHIEEAELMDVAGIDYYTKTIGNQYYIPLEYSDKKKKDKKASEYVFRPSKKKSFDNDKKEPYEIPTSHPILKGRLK